MMTQMSLYLNGVVYFPTNVGKFYQVTANRVIGLGNHFSVVSIERDGLKDILGALRNSVGKHRIDDSVRLTYAPLDDGYSGKSHFLAFALAEFMIAYASVPRSAGIDDRVETVSPDELQIVATGVIERDGKVFSEKTDYIAEKIGALLKASNGARGGGVFGARRKVFILPKAASFNGPGGSGSANEADISDRSDALNRLKDEGWEVHEIENILELEFLYEPVKNQRPISPPKPQKMQKPIRFGVLLGAVATGIIAVVGFALQNQANPIAPPTVSIVPPGFDAPVDPLPPIEESDDGSADQTALDEASVGALFAYDGKLNLEFARVKDDGSLGLILADAHPFALDDRVALIMTHEDSDRNALVIVRETGTRHEIAEMVLTPGNSVRSDGSNIRDLIGIGGGLTLFATSCASDCTAEADGFRAWVRRSVDAGLNGRTASMDGSAPLILNAELELQGLP